ncbi:MAG: hypothetical protein V2A73_20365 [Pseudomonadota bacterium]
MISLPIGQLWTGDGVLPADRKRELDRKAIATLLRVGLVRFVVANVGDPLRWVPAAVCYLFWKTDASVHLAEMDHFRLDAFPDGVAYVASEWSAVDGGPPIVLLEVQH